MMSFRFTSLPAALFAGLAVLAFLPASAGAKDGTVTVSAAGTDPRQVTVSLALLGAPDINNQFYELSSGRKQVSGYSMRRVLEEAERLAGGWLDLESLPSIEVDLPTAGVIRLSRSEALDRDYFRDGPPVFYENNGTTVFLMPGSPGAEYTFRLAPVGIKVGSELDYEVELQASPPRPKQGQSVTLTARVSGTPAGAELTYRWSLSDGTVKTTSTPRLIHRFEGAGRRSVVLTVTGGGGQGQAALSLDVIKVEGGGDGGTDTEGSSGGGGASFGGSGVGGSFVPGGTGSGGSGAAGGIGGASSPATPPANPDRQPAKPADRSGEGLEEVSGVVIDPVPSAAASAPEGGGPDRVEPAGSGGLGLPGEAATLAGIGLLIALGGLIEARILVRRA